MNVSKIDLFENYLLYKSHKQNHPKIMFTNKHFIYKKIIVPLETPKILYFSVRNMFLGGF